MKIVDYIAERSGDLTRFGALMLVAILVRYYLPAIVSDLFFIGLLVAYWRSDNEPFWLAVMLALTDGIFGFFGYFEACLTSLPGLPDIEITQFYILLALVKAWNRPPGKRLFYTPILLAMFVYLLFLIAQGYAVGISMELNMQLRSVRIIVPLTLLYSLPRLLTKEKDYEDFFKYCFLLAILACCVQVFNLTVQLSPMAYFGALEEGTGLFMAGETYRGLYSVSALLISFFGALYFLARRSEVFSPTYLYLIILANFTSVFLSATRGWVVCFVLAAGLFFTFVVGLRMSQIVKLTAGLIVLLFLASLSPFLNKQITNSYKRMLTLESVVQGDMTADGTLIRMSERSPRIIRKWLKSPLTGWGFSDYYYEHSDHHVGNQNILFHAGVVGMLLFLGFLFHFSFKLWDASRRVSKDNEFKRALLSFPAFLLAWFFLHSTSFQIFGYEASPGWGVIQGVFFSLGGFAYQEALQRETKRWARKAPPTESTPPEKALHGHWA